MTTADTTAELGCNPQQGVVDCVCRLIRPAADLGMRFLRCRSHAVTMAHRTGVCRTPWTVFLPYRLDGFPCFLQFDRQVMVLRHSCRAVAGKRHSCFRCKKTRKEAALLIAQSYFSCLSNSQVIQFKAASSRTLLMRSKGIITPSTSHSLPKIRLTA